MRDERGRYSTTKAVEDFAPDWAKGCARCRNGIVLAPELTGAASLYLERLVQAIDGDITFCTCQAGQRYRVSLNNRRLEINRQAKQDALGATAIAVGNQIDVARHAIHAAQAQRVPTVHVEGEKVPA